MSEQRIGRIGRPGAQSDRSCSGPGCFDHLGCREEWPDEIARPRSDRHRFTDPHHRRERSCPHQVFISAEPASGLLAVMHPVIPRAVSTEVGTTDTVRAFEHEAVGDLCDVGAAVGVSFTMDVAPRCKRRDVEAHCVRGC